MHRRAVETTRAEGAGSRPRQGAQAVRELEARLGEWVIAARWPIIAATLILVAIAASGGRFLEFSSDYRVFFSEDNPQLLAFEALEDTYTKNDNVLEPPRAPRRL